MIIQFLKKIRTNWEEYGLFVLAIISIFFIIFYAILRIGKRGSYDENRYHQIYSTKRNPRLEKYTQPYTQSYPQQQSEKKESTGELICRDYLERRFNCRFDKIRPDFLKNPVMGGYNLELDCFNKNLGLAIEYNGAQHYKYIPYFHRNKEAFANQKYRDEMKRTKCRENGILLIEVPYTVSHEKIPIFLEKELVKLGF